MKIHSYQNTPESNLNNKKTYHYKNFFAICVFSAFFISLLTYNITLKYFPEGISKSIFDFAVERGFSSYKKDIKLKESITNVPIRIINSVKDGSNDDIPRIYIDIKYKYLQKIYAKRTQALKEGALVQGENDFVPAKIRSDDKEIKVKLRLKGDWVDHLEGKKWSFRIHTKGKSHLFGLRRFSIQHPMVRGFHGEALIHEVFRQFDVLSPSYSFVDVVINGEKIGIMALEEHYSKELLERNGRKEGVIVRFDESLLWDANDGDIRGFGGAFDSYFNAPIDSFQSSKIKKSEHLSRDYATAVGLLRGFTRGQLLASDVFDPELMGRYLAIAQIFGAWHEIRWHNQRFYLNPLTQKLEPVAFDANIHKARPIGTNIIYGEEAQDYFNRDLLKDKKIYSAFQSTLATLKKNILNGSLINTLQEKEQPLLSILHREFFFLESFDYEELKKRALNNFDLNTENKKQIIESKKIVETGFYPQYTSAFLINNSEGHYLELLNALPYDIEVQSIYWVDKAGNKTPFKTVNPLKYPVALEKTSLNERTSYFKVKYHPPLGEKEFKLEVISNIKGDSKLAITKGQNYFEALDETPMPKSDLNELLTKNSFLFLENKNTITVKEGHWNVKGKIIVPKGYNFKITGNTHLQFEKDGCLVIYGSSNFLGFSDKPIVLKGVQNETWQGLVVFQANSRSKWSHVTILNTTGVNFPSWKLTGGATFYKSDVDIENSLFSGNMGEDALNIIHSNFTFNKVDITNTQSDGFDGDFVTGTITGGKFQDIGKAGGGDGVDISGSDVLLTGTIFNRVNDKAISVGENSKMSVSNCKMSNVSIGAASKDRSSLKIIDTQITNAKNVALMTYVKKPEYGSASLIAKRVAIIDSNKPAIVQEGSYLELNGEQIETDKLDIKQLYQTIMKPGVKK